ncbi:MAG: response regulator [Syntrophobacteraceae bacterium]
MTKDRVKGRVLIVDDEASIRRSLQAFLEDEGFDVTVAGTGEEGIQIMAGARIDAVIVDMRLPGIDGNVFIEKAHGLNPELNVLIYTGSVDYQPPPNLQGIGIAKTQVLMKPLRDMGMLASTLRDFLDREPNP